jgi:hypothetical protein
MGSCDSLALLAALFPDRMLALVMGEVERMANDPLPVAQRAPRIVALERELGELHRVEEALVVAAIAAGQPVHRSPSAPPAAVLGVRVADRASRAALGANRTRRDTGNDVNDPKRTLVSVQHAPPEAFFLTWRREFRPIRSQRRKVHRCSACRPSIPNVRLVSRH